MRLAAQGPQFAIRHALSPTSAAAAHPPPHDAPHAPPLSPARPNAAAPHPPPHDAPRAPRLAAERKGLAPQQLGALDQQVQLLAAVQHLGYVLNHHVLHLAGGCVEWGAEWGAALAAGRGRRAGWLHLPTPTAPPPRRTCDSSPRTRLMVSAAGSLL